MKLLFVHFVHSITYSDFSLLTQTFTIHISLHLFIRKTSNGWSLHMQYFTKYENSRKRRRKSSWGEAQQTPNSQRGARKSHPPTSQRTTANQNRKAKKKKQCFVGLPSSSVDLAAVWPLSGILGSARAHRKGSGFLVFPVPFLPRYLENPNPNQPPPRKMPGSPPPLRGGYRLLLLGESIGLGRETQHLRASHSRF